MHAGYIQHPHGCNITAGMLFQKINVWDLAITAMDMYQEVHLKGADP